MASGDLIAFIKPADLCPDLGPDVKPRLVPVAPAVLANGANAAPLGKEDGYTFLVQVPINGTPLSTGLTAAVVLADDPNNPGAGLAVKIGVTIVPVLTTAGVLSVPATTNEVTATATINATEGVVTITPVAVANNKLTSLAAGNWALVHLRRLGSDAADTHPGRVLIAGVSIKDT
jgi:hypothetical protein